MKPFIRHLITLLAVVAAAVALPVIAQADHGRRHQVQYVGGHPIPPSAGGGWCYIEAPHVHIYEPADVKLHYRDHHGQHYFVGDPVAYGYDGPRHTYDGPHPVQVDVIVGDDEPDTEWCYLKGPHYHTYEPAPTVSADFRVEGGAYFYVAEPPRAFLEARPELIKVNAIYEPLRYDRPVVEVDAPPPGWIGARVDIVGPAVEIVPPRADVIVEGPAPVRGEAVVGVGVHAGVIVQVPSVRVDVGLPSVHINLGGGERRDVIVVHDHDRDHDEHHHDNGRHRGWHKHH